MSKYNLFNFCVASILQLSIQITRYVKCAALKNAKQKKLFTQFKYYPLLD